VITVTHPHSLSHTPAGTLGAPYPYPQPHLQLVVEGTEFGDVLMTSGVRVAQGPEAPVENATTYEDTCGQATAVGFWMSWGLTPAPQPDPWPPGASYGIPFNLSTRGDWNHTMTWRRSLATNASDSVQPRPGDLSLIQSSNDLADALLWLPYATARQQVADGRWQGGVNMTVVAMLEQRAYGWYQYIRNSSAALAPSATGYLVLNATVAGTGYGLAKMPYLRESRRSQFGIDGFRLCHDFADTANPGPGCWKPPADAAEGGTAKVGYKWVDTIGIGNYGFDTHRLREAYCMLPSYLIYEPDPLPALPYYLPWRALTSWDAPNLIVVGKSMAETFFANAVTRLHPEEWTTGAAGGAVAAAMLGLGWGANTSIPYQDANRAVIASVVTSPEVGLKVEWTL